MKAIRALKIVLKDTVMSRERAYLEECIKELEELNNRSCDRCKFGKFGVDSIGIEVECSLNWNCSRGHSDKFEAKGE